MTATDPRGWDAPAEICLSNDDTLTLRRLTLLFHCNADFGCDSLPLEITVSTPDSLIWSEHFTARPLLRRKVAAVAMTAGVPYREDVVLGRPGDYTFELTPCCPVRGVEAAGIKIEPMNPPAKR